MSCHTSFWIDSRAADHVPEPCIRIHANTPDRFSPLSRRPSRMARGSQSCSNDEMVIPFYLANGATMKEALDWNISGCCEEPNPQSRDQRHWQRRSELWPPRLR